MSSFSENGRRRSGALTPQIMNIPLFVGQDTSIDPRVLQPGQNALVENGRLFNRGQVQKRYGFTSLSRQASDGSTITTSSQVFAPSSALFHNDGVTLRSWSPSAKRWNTLGRQIAPVVTGGGAVQSNATVTESSSASTATLTCVAWVESGAVYVSVVENSTQAQTLARYQLSGTGQSPNVVALGSDFYIFYAVASPAAFYCSRILGSSPNQVFGQSGAPGTPAASALVYDVVAGQWNNGTTTVPAVLGIFNTAGAGSTVFSIYAITSDLVYHLITTATPAAEPNLPTLPSIGSLGGTAYVYSRGDQIGSSYGPGAGPGTPTGIIFRRVAFASNNYAFFEVVTKNGTTYMNGIQAWYLPLGGTPVAQGPILWASETQDSTLNSGLKLASQPFIYGGRAFCWAVANSGTATGANNQSQWFLIDQAGAIVGNVLNNGLAAPFDGVGVSLAHPTNDGNGNFTVAGRYIQQIRSAATGVAFPVGVTLRTLAFAQARTFAQFVDGVTYLSGPAPQTYDGSSLTEWGFYNYPKASVTHSAGGSTLAGGTYLLYAVYGWYDATGKLWRSAPSAPLTVTIAASETITVTANYLQTTAKQNVFIEFYCTANIGGQTGVAPFKVGSVANVGQPYPAGTNYAAPVSPAVTSTTFAVTVSDAAISGGEPLYINGGGQTNITPPPTNFLSSSGTRLYLTAGELSQVYATSPAGSGSPLNVFGSQAITVPVTDSAINAAVVMDGKLFISTQRVWYVTNADASASSSTIVFNPVRRLAFDTGVSNPPSAFATLDGIYFQGQRGICLLERNESLAFVGETVKNYTEAVIDAHIIPQQELLRFVQGPRILCYDYQQKGWSQTVFAAVPNIISGCRWNDVGVIARPDGTVMVETPGVFTDDAVPVIRRIETPWIRPGQMGGWGRVWRFLILGERRSAHTLQVKIAYEDDPTYIDTLTILSEQVYGAPAFGGGLGTFGRLLPLGVGNPYGSNAAGNAYKFEGIMPRSKAGSFKFEISEINSTGEDSALNYLSLLYGVLPNLGQVPTGKKFG